VAFGASLSLIKDLLSWQSWYLFPVTQGGRRVRARAGMFEPAQRTLENTASYLALFTYQNQAHGPIQYDKIRDRIIFIQQIVS
jgi:hypothetical protein